MLRESDMSGHVMMRFLLPSLIALLAFLAIAIAVNLAAVGFRHRLQCARRGVWVASSAKSFSAFGIVSTDAHPRSDHADDTISGGPSDGGISPERLPQSMATDAAEGRDEYQCLATRSYPYLNIFVRGVTAVALILASVAILVTFAVLAGFAVMDPVVAIFVGIVAFFPLCAAF